MLKKKAIKKIFITTFVLFILLTIYLIPEKNQKNSDIEYQYNSMKDVEIYLMNDNNQLTKVEMKIKDASIEELVNSIISKLTISNDSTIPTGLKQIIPKNILLKDLYIDEGIVYLNFSKELLKLKKESIDKIVESISYSLLNLKEITGISIYVEEKNINEIYNRVYPNIITKDYGINKRVELKKLNDLNKVVIYYIDNINEKNYYVPITKYLNDEREKIKIIIDELSSNYIYESNLITLLDKNIELVDYQINNDLMILNFNNSIFLNEKNIVEEVVYTISYSVFDSYNDIETIIFKVNNQEITKKIKKDIE